MPLRDPHRRPLERAAAQRRAGDAPAAIETLAEVLTADPDHVAANAEMARALRLIGDPAGAEEHIRIALRSDLDYRLVVELAATVAERSRVDEAEQLIDAALDMAEKMPRLDPGEALLVRATIAHAQGRDDDARAVVDRIISDRPVRRRASAETLGFAERLAALLGPPDRTQGTSTGA